jgi:hypothetical protein
LISRSFTARSTKKAQTPILSSRAASYFSHHRISFPSFAMKNLLLLALVAFATIEANAQTSQPTTPMTKAERKAARQAKQPQVYKGSVAERRRMVTDAAGAESDRDGDDDATTTKSSKKSKSKN